MILVLRGGGFYGVILEAKRTTEDNEMQTAALIKALETACGYMLNAKIDLETGATKRTAINTIEDGLKITRLAIAKARGADQ